MQVNFKKAKLEDAKTIGSLVVDLTNEICKLTKTQHFNINLNSTIDRCRELIRDGHYTAIIGEYQNKPVAVVTFTETYALYAGGKIGVIQEFYVSPEHRALGVGSMLVEQVRKYFMAWKTAANTSASRNTPTISAPRVTSNDKLEPAVNW